MSGELHQYCNDGCGEITQEITKKLSVCPKSRAGASQAWGGQFDWEWVPKVAEAIGGSWGVLGGHKARPYGTQEEKGEGGLIRRARAGTRPAPTSHLRSEFRRGCLGGEGRYKACPYMKSEERGEGVCLGGSGQAQGLPLHDT